MLDNLGSLRDGTVSCWCRPHSHIAVVIRVRREGTRHGGRIQKAVFLMKDIKRE